MAWWQTIFRRGFLLPYATAKLPSVVMVFLVVRGGWGDARGVVRRGRRRAPATGASPACLEVEDDPFGVVGPNFWARFLGPLLFFMLLLGRA